MDTATILQSEVTVVDILMDKILSDEIFNCRGYIPPSDVLELARDIEKNGLQSPIVVQPFTEVDGKEYRIVSGHRRYTAYVVNKSERIPAIIKDGLTEKQAFIMNLNENTQRKALNILQEARAVGRLRMMGMTQDEISRALQQSRPWAQVRLYVLDFPEDIQETIGEGWLTQSQIHQIHTLPEGDDQYKAVRQIKDAKLAEGTKRLNVSIKKPAKASNLIKSRPRKKEEVETLMDHIMTYLDPSFATRCLAWAAGNISTLEVLKDVEAQCLEGGISYSMPLEGIPGL